VLHGAYPLPFGERLGYALPAGDVPLTQRGDVMSRDTEGIGPVTVHLLADHPGAIAGVATLRWREWGQPIDPAGLATWVATTTREAGREALPVSWVALDAGGAALGAVGLVAYDWDDRPERTPWVAGLIVRPDRRGRGIGGLLLARLEAGARSRGAARAWVATGGRAIAFYARCGWEVIATVPGDAGDPVTILAKRL